eukprot:CAMPEP_0177502986 /NCGR_PEP_ID=MMETSP0369-20130122/38069_1 /TAXON_ID=447022 ORGANISM="Scrippsiella hangoei-like, Strain SHHI-4" /NCGR_SAMPLE_ID=MMETSP0369 /ASSEMBLY_ACC=CAM_ASM_000364 /LENGTH=274 /DNA_ID=CAMNT_0018980633 /DNA_START=72 /DNA_END=893 /DNA_ORIENTATION=-
MAKRQATSQQPEGLILVRDFLSVAEERDLAWELLSPNGPWLDKGHLRFSNSEQQEFGPVISDAMEVVESTPARPMPSATASLAARVAEEAERLGLEVSKGLADGPNAFCRVNYYSREGGGYMHKHMDSKRTFGPVIGCCSLLADAAMTFYDTQGNSFGMAKVHRTVEVQLPRRSLYFMTGPSRSQWQHGIRKDQCPSERLSLTFRSVLLAAPRTSAGKAKIKLKVQKVTPMKRPSSSEAGQSKSGVKHDVVGAKSASKLKHAPAGVVKRRPAAA